MKVCGRFRLCSGEVPEGSGKIQRRFREDSGKGRFREGSEKVQRKVLIVPRPYFVIMS